MIPDQEPPFETIVFDCDSTLSSVEGIDELAGEQGAAVSDLDTLTIMALENSDVLVFDMPVR